MNKADLAEKVKDSGLVETKVDAEKVVDIFIKSICETVRNGDKVTIAGLGIFSKREVAKREVRNPRTGEKLMLEAHGRVKFVAAKGFKELVK